MTKVGIVILLLASLAACKPEDQVVYRLQDKVCVMQKDGVVYQWPARPHGPNQPACFLEDWANSISKPEK